MQVFGRRHDGPFHALWRPGVQKAPRHEVAGSEKQNSIADRSRQFAKQHAHKNSDDTTGTKLYNWALVMPLKGNATQASGSGIVLYNVQSGAVQRIGPHETAVSDERSLVATLTTSMPIAAP